ncbi:MAG: AmmeMemoRadiSam system protein B [Micromonosporaceae bacterium]|nr:AmmeMemoRadiSam system protein B [Micromonosporaceae bacterium]
MTTRPPAVAGMFYQADPEELAAVVDRLVGAVAVPEDDRLAEAYVVPHAGYRYSGPVAAQVYARLARHRDAVDRVVIIGPAHRVPLVGVAVTRADHWRTPLGEVVVDPEAVAAVVAAGAVAADEAHAMEHSLEVQVPFLQRVIGDSVRIVPICVGRSAAGTVAAIIDAAGMGRKGTIVICSTDLSHYLPEAMAKARDLRTAAAVMELSADRITPEDACGVFALRGLLEWARLHPPCRPVGLALATSAQTGGDPERVVGYPAFAFHRDDFGDEAGGGRPDRRESPESDQAV